MIKRKWIIIQVVIFGFLFVNPAEGILYADQKKNLSHLLQQLKTYQQGDNDSIVLELNAFVRSHRSTKEEKQKCERELILFLQSDATYSSKREVCRHLRIIGSKESVHTLEDMLLDPATTDMARYALEKIPGKSPDHALLRGLKNSSGIIQAGIVSSLGHRKVTEAVPYLEDILNKNTDLSVSLAAAAALGHIKNPSAAKALSLSLSGASKDLKTQVTGSLLKCAEEYLSKGDNGKAQKLYDQILSTDLPLSLHNSAVRGKINAAGQKGDEFILESLKHRQKNIHSYIEMIPEYFNASNINAVLELAPTLAPSAKVPLISILSLYPEKEVLQFVLDSAKSLILEVRIASLKTLKQIGSSSTVSFLAEHAASSKGPEQQQARNSLWGLKGADVNQAIVSNLKTEENPAIQMEYIKAVEERRIYSGKDVMLNQFNSPASKIQLQAMRSIKIITTPQDIPLLLEYLVNANNKQVREELMQTISFTASHIPDPLDRGEQVTQLLPEVNDPVSRSCLYLLLGRIGDDSTLPSLRKALGEPEEVIQDAAVRALAMWPTPAAADDVRHIARTSDKREYRILGLRSYIRMVEMEPFRRPEAAVHSLETALDMAMRTEEKIMILGVLPKFPCEQAKKLARKLLEDPDVKQEARNALQLIKEKLQKNRH
jgi:HEAT repeat protein